MLYLALVLMTAVVLALLVLPLWRRRGQAAARREYDLAVYRRQLAELEAEAGRGLIEAAAAAEARREIERRLLQADARAEAPAASRSWGRAVAVGLAVALPLAAAGLYLELGNPGLPDVPWAARQAAEATPAGHDAQMTEMVAQLAERMRRNPEDANGWRLLGRSYLTLGRFVEASNAFAQVLALEPDDLESRVDMAEALTLAADGQVTPAARVAFESALKAAPESPRPRYYLGLAAWQAGRPQEAYDRWLALARSAPPGAPWLAVVRERLAAVAGELGIDLAAELPPAAPPPAAASPPAAAPPPARSAAAGPGMAGPNAADVKAAAELSPEDRQAFIRSMVARLAERLESNPDDFDGWMRLGRARRVLGEPAAAAEAYGKAAALRPADPEPLAAEAAALIAAVPESAPPPAAAIQAYRRVLELAPGHAEALWFTGLAARTAGDAKAAVAAWERLLPQLDPASPQYRTLSQELAKARAGLD